MMSTKISTTTAISRLGELVNKIIGQAQLVLHHNKFGPKIFTQHQMVALLVLKHKSRLSYRDFVSWLYETRWVEWLKLREIPSKSTLHNYFMRIGMKIIRFLNRLATQAEQVLRLALDSTGIESTTASKHYEKRIKRIKSPHLKLSILINPDNLLILDWISEERHVHDIKHAEKILKRSKFKDIKTFVDMGYDSDPLMELANRKKNLIYCPIRDFKVPYPGGYFRQLQYERFEEDEYHQGRNPVECVNSLLKHNKLVIRAKQRRTKNRELAWCILVHNLERLVKAFRLLLSRSLWTGPYLL